MDADVSITHAAGGSVSNLEPAIKPARVRGSMIFYGEPLLLKLFVWGCELYRIYKYMYLPHTHRNNVMRQTARNVMRSVFARVSPKDIFIRYYRA